MQVKSFEIWIKKIIVMKKLLKWLDKWQILNVVKVIFQLNIHHLMFISKYDSK